jgi:hypothetical protein
MFRHRTLVLAALMLCLAIVPLYSTKVFAQGIPEVMKRLNHIQETLDGQIIPKLDQCNQCPECPECKAGFPKTGQTTSYQAGDDGSFQKGVPWPNPRFTDNKNGTITDNLTGLIWLKDANCDGAKTWDQAVIFSNNLANGMCGLSDGSSAGDWRLPNAFELVSLIDWGFWNPALSNTAGTGQCSSGDPFWNVVTEGQCFYFTSTTYHWVNNEAWAVPMSSGGIVDMSKSSPFYVWPVRNAK